jgi:hypothetical protein
MFKIVNYILIKDCKKKRSIDIGQVNRKAKSSISEIENKELTDDHNYTHNDTNGKFFYRKNEGVLYVLYTSAELSDVKSFQIIDKIIENNLATSLLNCKDDEESETFLHFIYNIVDTIADENMDEYCELRLNNSSQVFYVNKYREALLTFGESARASFRRNGFSKYKIIIILAIISIIILLVIILPIVI